MNFRTEIRMPDYPFRLSHKDNGLILGSCFAENIGSRLVAGKMPVVKNPFGVLYNPHSMAASLCRLTENRLFTPDELTCDDNGLWMSFMHHGSFSSSDRDDVLHRVNTSYIEAAEKLASADYLVLTLGTSWVYRLKKNGVVVGNCHKFPASAFERTAMSVDEIVETLEAAIPSGVRTIFTVSPIRHLRDGLAENQLSKSTLIVAAHELCRRRAETYYFPAYEIMMDDLRDYRFYAEDMTHPSPVAVEYIWGEFRDSLISGSSIAVFGRIAEIHRAMEHRPLHPDSESYIAFHRSMLAKCEAVQQEFPDIDMSREIEFFYSPNI